MFFCGDLPVQMVLRRTSGIAMRLLKSDQECGIMSIEGKRMTDVGSTRVMEGLSVNRLDREAPVSLLIDEFIWKASEEVLSPLPNDLTRLIYLASIRDYNSGIYRHPQMSRQFSAVTAHAAFELWHEQIFARLLTNSAREYVEQLEMYLRYSRVDRSKFVSTWKSLQAYKAAIPLRVPRRACELFFLNVETALEILETIH